MILAKNPAYHNAKEIKLDTITCFMISDSNTSVTMFYNKELDQIGIPGPRVQEFKDKGYKVDVYTDCAVFYIEMSEMNPVLKNINIRKAINAALDRDSFVKNVLKTSSLPAMGFVSPAVNGLKKYFRDEVPANYYKDNDAAGAKTLLAQGLKELGLDALPALNMISDDTDRAKLYAAAIQDMLKKNLGAEVVVNPMPFKARLQKMSSKDYDLVMAGWGPDYNDPMTFLDMWVTDGGNNHTSYSSATYDDLIKKAKAEPKADVRMKYLVEAEKVLMGDMPIAPIYWRFNPWTAQSNISGIIRRGVGPDPDLYWTVKK
jgi:oligopeptide transport system substrate-binding protein